MASRMHLPRKFAHLPRVRVVNPHAPYAYDWHFVLVEEGDPWSVLWCYWAPVSSYYYSRLPFGRGKKKETREKALGLYRCILTAYIEPLHRRL